MTTAEIGQLIKQERKQQELTQKQLALYCGVGLRFIVELESGKPSAQIAKVLHVLHMLGLKLNVVSKNAP